MSASPSHIVLFVGRFHPLLVHLPIGGLVLLGFLELMAGLTRWQTASQNRRWILGFVSAAALASAVCGWMLAEHGGYDPQLLKWHRALALGLTAACLLTFGLCQRERPRAYRLSLATTLALLGAASHLGGSITHGRDFLTRYAPAPLRAISGRVAIQGAPVPEGCSPIQQPLFTEFIQPILQEHCSACHREEKHKGDLRLDFLDGLLRGGRDGPIIKAGQADQSALIQRLLSPLDEDGHMPPEGQPQPTANQIALLAWWINAGAPAAQKVEDLKPDARIRRILEDVSKQPKIEN